MSRCIERIRVGDFYGDIIQVSRAEGVVFHCIVQREGSDDILYWTEAPNAAVARTLIRKAITQQSEPQAEKAAG